MDTRDPYQPIKSARLYEQMADQIKERIFNGELQEGDQLPNETELAERFGVSRTVVREAMKHVLPEVLYKREKFAFMAPPAHTDPQKWQAMQALADKYLKPEAIESAGLLNRAGVETLYKQHDDPHTTNATRNNMDAVFNHMLGVQVLHEHFVTTDVPAQALAKAHELGWSYQD
jgi:asparagine synthase (glutamine-hydrolysing)